MSEVSTTETPKPRNEMVVTTEENQEPVSSNKEATPPEGAGQTKEAKAGDQTTATRRDRKHERQVGKLTRRAKTAERTTGEQAARITELEGELETARANVGQPAEPDLKDFATPQEYAKEFSKWETQVAATAKPPAKKPDPKPAGISPEEREEIDEFAKTGKEKLGDKFTTAFDDKTLPLNRAMAEFVFDSDVGPEIIMKLAEDHDAAQEIFDAPAQQMVRKLVALEHEVTNPGKVTTDDKGKTTEPTKPAPKKAPEAPETVTTQGGTVQVDPTDMPMDDYAAMRIKQELANRM